VYLRTCLPANKITALGCDFVRPNRCAKEQLGTGVVGWHLLHFLVYLHDFVAALRLQMRKKKKI
jgi:hypothetical protein